MLSAVMLQRLFFSTYSFTYVSIKERVVTVDSDSSFIVSCYLAALDRKIDVLASRKWRDRLFPTLEIEPGLPFLFPYPKMIMQSSSKKYILLPNMTILMKYSLNGTNSSKFQDSTNLLCNSLIGGPASEHRFQITTISAIQLSDATLPNYFNHQESDLISGLEPYQHDSFYALRIDPDNPVIVVYFFQLLGYRYAVQTITQLLTMSSDEVSSFVTLPMRILDWPKYPWRGIFIFSIFA
jgi:hypothetical protein